MDTLDTASPIERAIAFAGGASALSRHLRITPQAVLQWRECPPNRVLEVERITGVSRHDLRPDIFGPASRRSPQKEASAS